MQGTSEKAEWRDVDLLALCRTPEPRCGSCNITVQTAPSPLRTPTPKPRAKRAPRPAPTPISRREQARLGRPRASQAPSRPGMAAVKVRLCASRALLGRGTGTSALPFRSDPQRHNSGRSIFFFTTNGSKALGMRQVVMEVMGFSIPWAQEYTSPCPPTEKQTVPPAPGATRALHRAASTASDVEGVLHRNHVEESN